MLKPVLQYKTSKNPAATQAAFKPSDVDPTQNVNPTTQHPNVITHPPHQPPPPPVLYHQNTQNLRHRTGQPFSSHLQLDQNNFFSPHNHIGKIIMMLI